MEIKKFIPMNDRVLLKPVEQGERKSGGIILADIGDEGNTKIAEVIAVGPGRKTEFGTFIEVNAKVGSLVVVPKVGAQRVVIDSEEYWTIADRELVATVEC